MKSIIKSILLIIIIFCGFQAIAQEKGSYLNIWGGVGPSGITYTMKNVDFAKPKVELKLGGQAGIGYSYFFTKNVGISLGVGLSHYRTQMNLTGDFSQDFPFILGNYTDNDRFPYPTDYELRVRIKDWVEYQSAKFLEIPLSIYLQKKFGDKEIFGFYLNAGVKFQIPVKTQYSVQDGDTENDAKMNVSGYYEEKNLELGGLGAPDLSQHGFGQIHNPSQILNNTSGNLNLKFNLSLMGDAGFLISLSRRVDISLGAYINYGLLNMRKVKENSAMFTGPETDYVSGAENFNVGNGINYNSVTQSEYVNRIGSISYGGKVGLRIKLGKLSERNEPEQESMFSKTVCDTVYIIEKQPVLEIDSLLKQVLEAIDAVGKQKPVQTETIIIQQESQPPVMPYDELKDLFESIYFDLDKADLKPASIKVLNKKVEILNNHPEIKLAIYGNTCDLGNDSYNFKLGQKRADAARDYLITKGVAKERLDPTTQASFYPELPNTNEPNRMHNRRADFKVMY